MEDLIQDFKYIKIPKGMDYLTPGGDDDFNPKSTMGGS